MPPAADDSKLILIVDDEEDFRAILEHLLERAGYRVVQAPNGTQAVAKFEAASPDLILLDLSMPDIDGIEVTRRIRGMAGGAKVPIVMLTVRSQILTVSEGLSAGVTDYVLKPFEMEDLLARIHRALAA